MVGQSDKFSDLPSGRPLFNVVICLLVILDTRRGILGARRVSVTQIPMLTFMLYRTLVLRAPSAMLLRPLGVQLAVMGSPME